MSVWFLVIQLIKSCTRYMRGIGIFPAGGKIFFFSPQCPGWLWGPSSLLFVPQRGEVVKWLGCEADHSPQSSAKVKTGGAIPLLPHTASWDGAQAIKHGWLDFFLVGAFLWFELSLVNYLPSPQSILNSLQLNEFSLLWVSDVLWNSVRLSQNHKFLFYSAILF
jgi:hypothetical protein